LITAATFATIQVMTTVLIVDDEKMITAPLARALTQAGYTVLVAANGLEGLAMARK
jgi:DNA-binding response OmpR family regulator